MKYHLLVYGGKGSKATLESIQKQDVTKMEVKLHLLEKGSEPFKKGALYAFYTEIMQITDGEVVILLQEGNTLAHPYVLKEVERLYATKDALLTYGGDVSKKGGEVVKEEEIPLADILNRKARNIKHKTMSLMTFYSDLFKKIPLTELLVDGFFPEKDFDYHLMLPMLEMAEDRAIYSKDILHASGACIEAPKDGCKDHSSIDNIS